MYTVCRVGRYLLKYHENHFTGNYEKVRELDNRVTQLAGFQSSYSVTGQTYPRIVDVEVVSSLSMLGSAVHKVNLIIQ